MLRSIFFFILFSTVHFLLLVSLTYSYLFIYSFIYIFLLLKNNLSFVIAPIFLITIDIYNIYYDSFSLFKFLSPSLTFSAFPYNFLFRDVSGPGGNTFLLLIRFIYYPTFACNVFIELFKIKLYPYFIYI